MGKCFSLHVPAHYEAIFNYMITHKTSSSVMIVLQHYKQQNPREGAPRATSLPSPVMLHQYKSDLVVLRFSTELSSVFQDIGVKTACKTNCLYLYKVHSPR